MFKLAEKNNKEMWTLFLVVFMDLLGFGLILPLLPFIAERFGGNEFQIGLLAATYSFFQFIAAPILGKLSDKYGRKKLLIISQIGSGIGFLLLGFANSLTLLFISRIIDGITGGNISIAQAYVADITDKENRSKGMGIVGAAFGLGFIVGPAMGGLLSKYSFSLPAFVATGMALLTALATFLFLEETVKTNKIKLKIREVFGGQKDWYRIISEQGLMVLTLSFLALNLAQGLMQGMFPLWAERSIGYGPENIGWFFAYIGILSIIIQLKVLPWFTKMIGEVSTLKLATVSRGLGLFAIPLVMDPKILVAVIPLFSLGGMANPTLQALVSEKVDEKEYGKTLGVVQSSGSLGRILGPIIGGQLFFQFGAQVPFWLSASLMIAIALWMHKSIKKVS